MKRRTLLKTSLAASVVMAVGSVIPGRVMAAYPKAAFENKDAAGALNDMFGTSDYAESGDIKIKAPEIAENGAVVPVQVSSSIANIESISIVVSGNPTPMIASFNMHGSEGFVSTRIKMGKTSDVLAVVKAGGSLHATRQEVKVTIGGCGG
ncbi:MAG: thiosulfate oxidation carrier protein SoxY [Gammaproteobacteria bacterium]|nr:thiosulfate oxidation carrier protein SoxY [Gammaproteobacteria bacterium]